MEMNKELVKSLAFYGALLAGKVLVMAFLTARQRFAKKAFANPEDAISTKGKVTLQDPDVERVRRAHQNDIENIFPFFFLAPLYLLTNPSVSTAMMCFRVFTAARFIHSFAYIFQVPQPSRALAFFVGMIVNFYMIYCIITGF